MLVVFNILGVEITSFLPLLSTRSGFQLDSGANKGDTERVNLIVSLEEIDRWLNHRHRHILVTGATQ